MLNINKVALTGRLTRDPETKFLATGNAVTKIGIAVNRRYQDRSGEWKEETFFLDVEVFGKAAERAGETLRKGSPVYVEGRLRQDSWERDGQRQSKMVIVADRVTGFEVPSRGQGGGGAAIDHDEGHSGGGSSYGGGHEAPAPRRAAAPPRSSAPITTDELAMDRMEDDIPF